MFDSPASGYPGAYKLINIHHSVIFVKKFLHRLISEVSRYNICKFDQIASNSLQVIKIVHELFDCPSYISKIKSEVGLEFGVWNSIYFVKGVLLELG